MKPGSIRLRILQDMLDEADAALAQARREAKLRTGRVEATARRVHVILRDLQAERAASA